ncbi:post-PEP-CTERM-1 domain-containing protein [Lysobacter koreensis]|uniref:Post-PEP-CTERM-1 domain-containing protein n=1 Tax=Lysobacter koreensis TaxID=266122 RepID=A0ABW2YJZ9_9GAMM
MNRTGTCVLLSGLALGACMNAHAVEPKTSPQPAAAAQATTAETTFGGIKVGIDAKTGRLRPLSVEESAQLDQMLTQGRAPTFAPGMARTFNAPDDEAAARATVRQHGHGGVSVKLPEDQMSTVSVRRDAAGKLHIEHSDDAANAAAREELK